jgi:hypothetical protein
MFLMNQVVPALAVMGAFPDFMLRSNYMQKIVQVHQYSPITIYAIAMLLVNPPKRFWVSRE